MSFDQLVELARDGRLYPSLILHGADLDRRLEAAIELARTVLCEAAPADRPCGTCRHCRRIGVEEERFHPDVRILRRDLAATTSVEATRECLHMVRQTPFEADGQAVVVAEADTLSPEAADTLLKVLEEPPTSAPRHFFLLTPAQQDLLATVRSRSWSVYLGEATAIADEDVEEAARRLAAAVRSYEETGAAVYLQAAAAVLEEAADWSDLRAELPWSLAAAVATAAARAASSRATRRSLLALAADVLDGRSLRLRRISPQRVLEGSVFEHLGGGGFEPAGSPEL